MPATTFSSMERVVEVPSSNVGGRFGREVTVTLWVVLTTSLVP